MSEEIDYGLYQRAGKRCDWCGTFGEGKGVNVKEMCRSRHWLLDGNCCILIKVLLVLPRLWKPGEKMAKLVSQPFSWTLRELWKSAAFQWYPVLFFVSHHLRQSPAKISLQKNIFSHIGLGSLLWGSPSFAAGKRPVEIFPGPCRGAFRRTHEEGHRINSPKGEDEQEVWALLSHHQHCGPPAESHPKTLHFTLSWQITEKVPRLLLWFGNTKGFFCARLRADTHLPIESSCWLFMTSRQLLVCQRKVYRPLELHVFAKRLIQSLKKHIGYWLPVTLCLIISSYSYVGWAIQRHKGEPKLTSE